MDITNIYILIFFTILVWNWDTLCNLSHDKLFGPDDLKTSVK